MVVIMKAVKSVFIILMAVQGVLWISWSVFVFINRSQPSYIGMLMLGNGLVFLVSTLVYNRNRFFKTAVMGFIAINLILTLTDQMGLYDYIVLVLNIASLVFGVVIWKFLRNYD
jgi:hypothetical protein